MGVLKLLLNSILILITAITFCSEGILRNKIDIIDYHLQDYVTPKHYNVELVLYIDEQNAENFSFHGKISVLIRVTASTEHLRLHMLNLEITTIELVKKEKDFTISPEYPFKKSNYIKETQILEIYFNKELLHGDYILTMSFYGARNNSKGSFFVTSYVNEGRREWLAVTRFGARQLFPCWDEPALKTTFNISIKHHEKYKVLSNERMQIEMIDVEENVTWTHFHTTPKISTHQVAVVLFEFPEVKTTAYETHRMLCRNNDVNFQTMFAQVVAESIMHKLATDFKSMRQFPLVQQIAIPGFLNEGMSYFGLIFYRESAIIYNSELDPIGRKLEVASLVARQISRQCFGNLVSPSWWSSWWLYEAIAILFELDVINQFFPEFPLTELFVVHHHHESLHLDSYFNISIHFSFNYPLEVETFFFFFDSYKAATMMRMLQNIISSEIYENGITKFIDRYAYSSATSDDLWIVMQDVLNETSVYKPLYVNIILKLMINWAKIRHYPVLNVKRQAHFDHWNWINVSINNFNALEIHDKLLYIPITIATQFYPDFDTLNYNFMDCDWKLCAYSFPADYAQKDWILINLQQVGYYRVNYNPDIWQSIVTYLNSPNYTKIHLLNRAQIIDDAFHFMMAGKLEVTIFWNLTSYLSRETNYVAWYPMFKALEYMSRIFTIPDKRVNDIKKAMLPILDQLLHNIGYPEETHLQDHPATCLREEAAKWACIFDSYTCTSKAITKLSGHFGNPKEHKILPWWKKWTYCNALKRASNDIWYNVLNKWAAKPDMEILVSLACSALHPRIFDSFSRISIFKNNASIEINDQINHFLVFTANFAKYTNFLEYLFSNLRLLKTKHVSTFAALTIIINHACDQAILDTINILAAIYLTDLKNDALHMLQASFIEMVNIMIRDINKLVLNIQRKKDIVWYEILSKYVEDESERLKFSFQHRIKKYASEIQTIVDIFEQLTSNIQSKIRTRQSEIEKHKKYLHILSIPDI